MANWVGKEGYEEAMRNIVTIVDTMRTSSISISQLGSQHSFSYRLTPKQQDAIKKVCKAQGWAIPFCKGIEIDASTVNHILDSRLQQKGVTVEFVIEIMLAAYNQFAEIYVNKNHGEQAVFLNGLKQLQLEGTQYHAVAIVAMNKKIENSPEKGISSVTAYHADQRKVQGIKNAKKPAHGAVKPANGKSGNGAPAQNGPWRQRA